MTRNTFIALATLAERMVDSLVYELVAIQGFEGELSTWDELSEGATNLADLMELKGVAPWMEVPDASVG